MRREEVVVSSNGGKEPLLHRSNCLRTCYGCQTVFIVTSQCLLLLSTFFVFYSEWATLKAHHVKIIYNFLKMRVACFLTLTNLTETPTMIKVLDYRLLSMMNLLHMKDYQGRYTFVRCFALMCF